MGYTTGRSYACPQEPPSLHQSGDVGNRIRVLQQYSPYSPTSVDGYAVSVFVLRGRCRLKPCIPSTIYATICSCGVERIERYFLGWRADRAAFQPLSETVVVFAIRVCPVSVGAYRLAL